MPTLSIVLDLSVGEWEEPIFLLMMLCIFSCQTNEKKNLLKETTKNKEAMDKNAQMDAQVNVINVNTKNEENSKREDQSFWVETPPNDITYKLKLLGEYDGRMLSEQNLCKHGFKGGRSLETPSCNNTELINYIKSVF